MRKFRPRRPSPALIISVIALFAATTGTALAAIGIGDLTDSAKDKTVGVGKLTYVNTNVVAPKTIKGQLVTAACPKGLRIIGGGIKGSIPGDLLVDDSYPTSTGWAGHVTTGNEAQTVTTTAICAKSRVRTGAPPVS